MPPKKAAATTATDEDAPPKRATARKATTAATKKASTPAPATTKASTPGPSTRKATTAAAAAAKKATTAAAAAKKGTTAAAAKNTADDAAPKKAAVAPKRAPRKTAKTADESDKENSGAKPKANSKRKRTVEPEEHETAPTNGVKRARKPTPAADEAPPVKKAAPAKKVAAAKVAAPKPAPAPKRVPANLKIINERPTQVLDVFVFGEGSSGELGLGSVRFQGKKPIDVKRPRINHNLKGVVQVSCGGMHAAALTEDNKILTWGVNDQGALGRDTTWEGGLRDMDDEDSDSGDDDDSGLNPRESTPTEIDMTNVPQGTVWVQIVTSDSATFALTQTGHVWGWGTFRSNEGILGFSKTVLVQKTPVQVTELTKVKQLAAGANHILALDEKNKIYAWGAGQQAQLARRLLERDDVGALLPTSIGALPGRAKATRLACGSYHCFVIDTKGRLFGWGLNNFAELGIKEQAGEDGGFVMRPERIDALDDVQIASVAGGMHHSLACTTDGDLITWGRIDGHQVGLPDDVMTEDNAIFDEKQTPRILFVPTKVPGVENVVSVAAGTDHCLAVTGDGQVYTWGFSGTYQTGQGTIEDIPVPTLVDNSAIRDRVIVWAGAGSQYSIIAALPEGR